MNLKGVVSVSGRPGLFKLIGQNKSAFVLENLEDQKVKIAINISTTKLASLEDITVFGDDDDLRLSDIFIKMKSVADVPDPKKADSAALRGFFRDVAPGHDEERVYSSDMKKIITWFNILKELPLFSEEAPEAAGEAKAPVVEEKKPDHAVAVEKAKPTRAAKKPAARMSQKSK